MDIIKNIDLLSVGFAIAATGVLGFLVYFSNKKSITNKVFLWFSLVTVVWSIVNYLNYQSVNPIYGLFLIRLTIFFGIFHAFSFFELFTVFPEETYRASRLHRFLLIPWVFVVALLTLTPYVFNSVKEIEAGRIIEVVNGPLLPLYGITTVGLVVAGIVKLIRKLFKSSGVVRRQLKAILLGTALTFSLLIIFNFIFPTVFNNSKYIPFGPLFLFPLIIFTSYAILKQQLFKVKVASTAIVVFVLSGLLFFEIIYTNTVNLIIFRSSIFLLTLVFGINLIRSVLKEVEQREKIETLAKELQDANEKLKSLDKLKTEFLSLASHQLRSPLTAIKGYASMLFEGSFGKLEAKQEEAAKRVYSSAEGLANIVEDLLNVTKIEQGGMKYEMIDTDIAKIANDTFEEMAIPAKLRKLEFSIDMNKDEAIMTKADPLKMKQVFLNIVDNSIKYTQTGFVKMSLKKDGNKAVFKVWDSGIGMSQETIDNIFDKFTRGEGKKVNTGGSGLGMYLAKQIVLAHKGEINVHSDGVGKGSTFEVKIPLI